MSSAAGVGDKAGGPQLRRLARLLHGFVLDDVAVGARPQQPALLRGLGHAGERAVRAGLALALRRVRADGHQDQLRQVVPALRPLGHAVERYPGVLERLHHAGDEIDRLLTRKAAPLVYHDDLEQAVAGVLEQTLEGRSLAEHVAGDPLIDVGLADDGVVLSRTVRADLGKLAFDAVFLGSGAHAGVNGGSACGMLRHGASCNEVSCSGWPGVVSAPAGRLHFFRRGFFAGLASLGSSWKASRPTPSAPANLSSVE